MAKVKLLLAGKREIFREGLAKLLERQTDIEVVCTCRTGLEAVDSAHEHQPDVILIDTELLYNTNRYPSPVFTHQKDLLPQVFSI